MAQTLVARIACPNCRNQFQTPVEQIIDVRQDPAAKFRVLNGLVNIARCPHCGAGGQLGIPFLYHDPDHQVALVYLPMEAGRTDLERQRLIGDLTTAVMNSLPQEERKGYLFQPQTMFSMESLMNKVLEIEGITPEMIEEQKNKAALLRRMLEAPSDEAQEIIIRENDATIDGTFFQILAMNFEVAQATGQIADLQRLATLHNKLLELSSEGKWLQTRSELIEALRTDPTQENLLDLLIRAPDAEIREALIALGLPLVDYRFFQSLTARIEATEDAAERDRLTAMRAEILRVRDEVEKETHAVYAERATLLRDLLLSNDPESLARRRFAEMDQAFLNVLTANIAEAREAEDEQTVRALQAIWQLVVKLTEETLPPEVRLFNRLMAARDEAEVDSLLRNNRRLVTKSLVEFMQQVEAEMREEQDERSAEALAHLGRLLHKIRAIVGA